MQRERLDPMMLGEEKIPGDSIFPLSHQNITLEKIEDERRWMKQQDEHHQVENAKEADEGAWSKHACPKRTQIEGSFTTHLKELPANTQEVLKVAACLASLDLQLLRVATLLSEDEVLRHLQAASVNHILFYVDGEYAFLSNVAEQEAYGLISSETRDHIHLTLGRRLVQHLSKEALEHYIYNVLLQFHSAMNIITSPEERTSIAALCLRAIHCAMRAPTGFRAACNYSEFGILLLPPHHWKDEYDLTLALYNASAEVFHCAANYQRVDELVSAVLDNARCYRDTLHVRATRVNSLSSTNRLTESLEEGLDVLKHVGVEFPSKPRKYHAAIALMRTKRLLRNKTKEMILRMPLMDNADKIVAMQMLNLIFPVAYHLNRILFALLNLRLVRLTIEYGLSAISAVGFAAYSVMLVTLNDNKETGFQYSELALELLQKFGIKEYIPRVYYFVYAEAYTFKCEIRSLRPQLLEAYEIGLKSGDIQYALYNSILMEFGYMLFSGDLIISVEEKMRDYYKTAVTYKQDTALLMIRPLLRFLHIMMNKLEVPKGIAFPGDLARAKDGDDEFAAWAIHFLQVLLAYIFGNYETAANEAREIQGHLRVHLHPGFSGVLTLHCLALLAVASDRHGLSRLSLLIEVRRSMKKLEQFSLYVPDNCLHKLNFVQAELAVVHRNYDLARSKYSDTISLASEINVSWIQALASERFALFLQGQGDEDSAAVRFRDARDAYQKWGAVSKVEQLEKQMPNLFMKYESAKADADCDTIDSVDDMVGRSH